MHSVSLLELNRFGSFAEFAAGAGNVAAQVGNPPTRPVLLSRAEAAAGTGVFARLLAEAIGSDTPAPGRSATWKSSLDRLAREPVSLILARYCPDPHGGSMAQLLKCLTAARLARELDREGVPAVALCWLDPTEAPRLKEAEKDAVLPPVSDVRKFTEFLNNVPELPIVKDVVRVLSFVGGEADAVRFAYAALVCLAQSIDWLVVDPAGKSVAEVLKGGVARAPRGGEGFRAHMRRAVERMDLLPGPAIRGDGSRLGAEFGSFSAAAALPVGVLVAGPDDLPLAVALAETMQSAGLARPAIWPRLSATVVDRRSRLTMMKYRIGLADVLADGDLAAKLIHEEKIAAALGEIDAIVGSSGSLLEGLAQQSSADTRLARKIRAAGVRVGYQLRKFASRSRAAAEERRLVAGRQVGRLSSSIAPGGRLQEESLYLAEVLLRFSPATLVTLLRDSDPWDHKHQLICPDTHS